MKLEVKLKKDAIAKQRFEGGSHAGSENDKQVTRKKGDAM